MRAIDFVEKLRNSSLAVFRLSDISRMLGKGKGYSSIYLHRLTNKGYIELIEKGKYTLKGTDIYSVASNIVSPSYVSFLSGLAFYDLTTQMPNRITVVCSRSKKAVHFRNYTIEFVRFNPKKIVGIERIKNKNAYAFVAKKEKVIIDSLSFPAYCPIDESARAIEEADLDIRELLLISKKVGSIAALKRLGYLLDKKGVDTYNNLKGRLNTRYDLLDPYGTKKGEKNRKWRLIVNG